ncbi:hypothetical protein Prudu_010886 [Prunus dulcis]|uniref:Bulb-type lectin domain-containing protein n=1 Tax=Prunus dulcis TaxID=3755 RepID=A0A4Y1RA26_PRUDU|nr:hypothetical protein Prudu_010886 [Prunus dulcis]
MKLTSSQPLAEGQTLVSPGHIFELGFFSPNNSANKYVGIWHKTIFPRKVVSVANIEKALSVTDTLASFTINSNGNLELVDGKQSSIWSTNISVSSNGSAALLLDSGDFVVQDDIGAQLWRSFDYPVDTLLPMMLLGFDNKSGKRDVLTAWKSESDGSTGLFSVGLAPQIPTQIALSSTMFILFLFSLLLSQHHCAEVYNISSSQPLAQGQTLVSPCRIFELGFFSPNNNSDNNKEKPIAAADTLASLAITSNGNLELVDGKQNSVWSTNIPVPSNTSAAMLLDSGNFVVKVSIGAADQLWQSFDYPGDTLLPSMRLGFDSKSGKRNVLTAWKSESDPSTGMFLIGLTPQLPSQIVIRMN